MRQPQAAALSSVMGGHSAGQNGYKTKRKLGVITDFQENSSPKEANPFVNCSHLLRGLFLLSTKDRMETPGSSPIVAGVRLPHLHSGMFPDSCLIA